MVEFWAILTWVKKSIVSNLGLQSRWTEVWIKKEKDNESQMQAGIDLHFPRSKVQFLRDLKVIPVSCCDFPVKAKGQ